MNMIKVKVVKRKTRKYYVLRYSFDDGVHWKEKKINCTRRRDADREAIKYAQQLTDESNAEKVDWTNTRQRYERESLSQRKPKGFAHWTSAANRFQSTIDLPPIDKITTDTVLTFTERLRDQGLTEASIDSYLAELRAFFRWCRDEAELIYRIPRIRLSGKSEMKGRPLSLEEFERMSMACHKLFNHGDQWEWCLNGLWLFGESVELSWDDVHKPHIEGINDEHPLIKIPREFDKGNKSRYLPLAPEFVQFLRDVPEEKQIGRVFPYFNLKGELFDRVDTISKQLTAVGRRANVIVSRPSQKIKYASAHDLRRSFAQRWASDGLPAEMLQIMMRHQDFKTTQKFYLGERAKDVSKFLQNFTV